MFYYHDNDDGDDDGTLNLISLFQNINLIISIFNMTDGLLYQKYKIVSEECKWAMVLIVCCRVETLKLVATFLMIC